MHAAASGSPSFLYFAPAHTHAFNFAGPAFWGTSVRGAFGDALSELDWAVGQISTAVRQSGRWSETLTLFTSDNGAAWPHRFQHAGSTGPMRCGKGTFYEGGVRVPAIVTWPGMIAPASLSTSPASTLDILPTFIALASGAHTSAGGVGGSGRRVADTTGASSSSGGGVGGAADTTGAGLPTLVNSTQLPTRRGERDLRLSSGYRNGEVRNEQLLDGRDIRGILLSNSSGVR